MGNQVILEICADSVESAVAAQKGGAHRVELCADLLEGGVTPSAGLISSVRPKLTIDLHVMIRPRGGDFCYSHDEFETMEQDLVMAKQLGAQGVVFGILKQDGDVDIGRTRRLVEIARPMKTTFHRAFDMSRDLTKSLRDLMAIGVDRVLTSGGEQNAEDAIPLIQALMRIAQGRIAVMAGGGIVASNARRILDATGVREIHASARVHAPSPMRHRNEKISMGLIKGREYERATVSEEKVTRLLNVLMNGSLGED